MKGLHAAYVEWRLRPLSPERLQEIQNERRLMQAACRLLRCQPAELPTAIWTLRRKALAAYRP